MTEEKRPGSYLRLVHAVANAITAIHFRPKNPDDAWFQRLVDRLESALFEDEERHDA
jgi:hypothetical protein